MASNGAFGAVMGLYISCVRMAVEAVIGTNSIILFTTIISSIYFSTILTFMPKIGNYIDWIDRNDHIDDA